MKRMHVHVAVDDLAHSIGFYSALFSAQPSVTKTDYAKWMLDDPRVNFAISTHGRQAGLDHLGIQVEDKDELKEIYARLHKAGGKVIEQGQTSCCYAKSEKSWIDDPAGISWETFLTSGESTDYGDGTGEREARVEHEKACCVLEVAAPAAACGCQPDEGAMVEQCCSADTAHLLLQLNVMCLLLALIGSAAIVKHPAWFGAVDAPASQAKLKEIGRLQGSTAKATEPT